MITVGNILLSILFLMIIPVCLGYLWCEKMHIPVSFPTIYVFGMFFIWSYSQLVLVPMILMDASFTITSIILLLLTIAFMAAFLYQFHLNNPLVPNGHFKRFSIADYPVKDIIAFAVMLMICGYVIYNCIVLQHTDADDSRFVVLAMDTVKSDRMLRINPATGRELIGHIGEMKKDFSSPWAVFLAYISNICGMKASSMIHSLVPVYMYILVSCGLWILADVFFEGQFVSKCFFVSLVWYLIIFSNYSEYNSETFIMVRIWQGKAIVAGLTIPMILYGLVKIFQENTRQNWLNLCLINLGSCMLSGNAIVIDVLMICCYGLVYSLVRKNYKIIICSAMLCIPNFLFFLVNQYANQFL